MRLRSCSSSLRRHHSREKTLGGWVNVLAFSDCRPICPVLSLREYLARTAPLHYTDAVKMFIQLMNPHKSMSAQTLAWWMTNIMTAAGVDDSMFKQHSTCGALSVWLETGTKRMSVAQISRKAQWSSLTTIYRKFYHKVVL